MNNIQTIRKQPAFSLTQKIDRLSAELEQEKDKRIELYIQLKKAVMNMDILKSQFSEFMQVRAKNH